jgi:hypothetical protein
MLKINTEKFDELLETEFKKSSEYTSAILDLREKLIDDEVLNKLILNVGEIAFEIGFKKGLDFIVNREKNNLF